MRMVQVYYGNFQPWDNHDDIMLHRDLADTEDGPIAALLQDLKASGLLDETIVSDRRRVRPDAGGRGRRAGEGAERPRPQQSRLHVSGCGRRIQGRIRTWRD